MRVDITNKLNDVFMVSHHNHNTIAPMEGLRAFAAFMVFLVHFSAQSQVWIPNNSITFEIIFNLRFVGATGVDLFFVLSGFLIYGMLIRKSVQLPTYIYRRVKRIYPAFLCVMLIYLILSYVFPAESKLPLQSYDAFVYLLQCFLLLPGVFDIEPLFSVAWTLSYELFFYIITPFIILLLKLRNWTPKYRIAFLLIVSLLGFYLSYENTSHIQFLMFLSGMILYELRALSVKAKWLKAHLVLPLTIVLMLVVRHGFETKFTWLLTLIMFVGYGLTCLNGFNVKTAFGAFFSKLPLRWLGNMSYSYYLIHGLTLKFLFMLLAMLITPDGESTWVFYTFMIPFFIITLLTSFILFFFIEKRFSFGKSKYASK
jgi:peptidoglycan/LPS O-acetylase OafA/YrhL